MEVPVHINQVNICIQLLAELLINVNVGKALPTNDNSFAGSYVQKSAEYKQQNDIEQQS